MDYSVFFHFLCQSDTCLHSMNKAVPLMITAEGADGLTVHSISRRGIPFSRQFY